MKREGTIGAATLLAIAAVVGVSLQTGPKQERTDRADESAAIKRSKSPIPKKEAHQVGSACSNLEEQLEEFLGIEDLHAPDLCYAPGDIPTNETKNLTQKTSHLKFVIALLPDPVHTHLPVIFDQFAVAIQEGAQDEKYDFDSSWLPWDNEESPYPLFVDQKASDLEKDMKEDQPGILLFRKALDPSATGKQQSKCNDALSESFCEGLVVFVVGEQATQGVHREEFRNALGWVAALETGKASKISRLAILGPTFSGSFPSLAQVLSEPRTKDKLDLHATPKGQLLAIYSGSVSGHDAALAFQSSNPQVTFHSFVQDDDEILRRFCNYIRKEQPGFDAGRVAIVSEDETAYGSLGMDPQIDDKNCQAKALKLYYPRDISALRGAYQTKSLFDMGTSPQPAETRKRSLPTDLSDPSGKVNDSIHSYGGNQTPLTQEAILVEIVATLRELNVQYILLRGSNSLDQLFLTNFIRRGYPDGRIVIFSSDLMFIRERGTTGFNGTMTVSTYPLFPLEPQWTDHQSLPAADRVFGSDTTEGTYVAFRLLLNEQSLNGGAEAVDRCHVLNPDPTPDSDKDRERIFLPPVACGTAPPIPDYSPPFWMLPHPCGEMKDANVNTGENCPYPGPATWLSVISGNRLWPMASLTRHIPQPPVHRGTSKRSDIRRAQPGGRPEMPLVMTVFLLALIVFSLFHAWCCWAGSYTAKPAFLAHFASTGEFRHTLLVFLGSCCVAALAVVTGWGCGVFSAPAAGLAYPWFPLVSVSAVCLIAWLSILANSRTACKLSQDSSSSPELHRMTEQDFAIWNYQASGLFVAAMFLLWLSLVFPAERVLLTENRVLTYWRAMHLTSGVSPIIPILLVLIGMYLSFWFTLHGLALFGPDRPCLPPNQQLALKDAAGNDQCFLRMFSQEDAATAIEHAAMPPDWKGVRKIVVRGLGLFVLFLAVAFIVAKGVPIRTLGARNYAIIFLVSLDICCTMAIIEIWQLRKVWKELKRLLAFLDRLPLRRTMESLHGFSWGGVWKMSGNVLEVRYKIISRQMECMHHTIASLQEFLHTSSDPEAQDSLAALTEMQKAGMTFAKWYSGNYVNDRVGDLTSFSKFQESIASASGTLLSKLLVPAWRREKMSLLVACEKDKNEANDTAPPQLALATDEHIRNAEEFVCLNYVGFIQNVLGRLRTMTFTIMLLLIVSTVATSTYPFDPQQVLSAVLIVLFVIVGVVIVKVYADMHRDSTLSHVTNTKPGELGTEFWFKIAGFGFAPLIGLLSRIFPDVAGFLFSWLQPGISSLK